MIKRLNEMLDVIRGREKKRLVVAAGEDPHTIEAVARAYNEGLCEVTLVGDPDKIKEVANAHNVDISKFEIVEEKDPKKAAKVAVRLIREGKGDALMKGLVDTATYMRAILNKEEGLLKEKKVLSHVTVVEFPLHHKLLIVSDVAVIIHPTLEQKIEMIKYTIEVANALGIDNPKIAIISAVEKVNPKMPSTIDAALLKVMGERGQIKGGIIDGPLALDIAVSKECLEIKGLKSPVDGDADILIFPDIVTGNVFFKTATQLAGGRIAAIVTGTDVPCVLTSRADSEDSKFYSIALAVLVAGK